MLHAQLLQVGHNLSRDFLRRVCMASATYCLYRPQNFLSTFRPAFPHPCSPFLHAVSTSNVLLTLSSVSTSLLAPFQFIKHSGTGCRGESLDLRGRTWQEHGTWDQMGRACSTHYTGKKCIRNFGRKTRREETTWETDENWKIILERILDTYSRKVWTDAPSSG
jgi:hypothetical protein